MATRNRLSGNALGEHIGKAFVVILPGIVVTHRSQIYQAPQIPTNLSQASVLQIPASRLDILVFEFPMHTRPIRVPFSSSVPVSPLRAPQPLDNRAGGPPR